MGNEIEFGFNNDRQIDQITDPKNKTEERSYINGNLDEIDDARFSSRIEFNFDPVTGLSSSTDYVTNDINTIPPRSDDTFTRDAWGRVIQIDDDVGKTTITYDSSSRVHTVDGPWSSDTITYTYDSQSHIASYAVENGQQVVLTYDNFNRLGTIKRGSQNTYRMEYRDPTDELSSITYPNNAKRSYVYDYVGRLHTVDNRTSSNSLLSKIEYTYNWADQIKQMDVSGLPPATISTNSRSYQYDDADQIEVATQYGIPEYDSSGNPTSGKLPGGNDFVAKYNSANQLTALSWGTTATDYRIEYTYGWDDLIGVIKYYTDTSPDSNPADDNLRGEIRFIRDIHSTNVVQRRNRFDGVTDNFIWLPNDIKTHDRLLENYTGTSSSSSEYQFHDGRGNIVTRTSHNNLVLGKYRYDPYGNIIGKSGSSTATEYGYQSKYKSSETGLIDFGYRQYDPKLLRWMNRDPLLYGDGTNRYSYLHGDPINNIDRDGLFGDLVWDGINVGTGSYAFSQNINNGHYGAAAIDAVGVLVDLGAAAIPFLPGGAGTFIKSCRATQRIKTPPVQQG